MAESNPSRFGQFRRFFWRPPRAHGDVIEDRSVSFLELFYDLVYVVVIARAAHHLADHVSWRGAADFVVVFGMIWIAWVNGTMYHDLHGRGDGRTRTFVFLQMGILALLGVFTSAATGIDGPAFAVVYAVYMLVLTWLWFTVQLQDDDSYRAVTVRYLIGMVATVVIVGGSAFVKTDLRVALWAMVVVGWIVGTIVLQTRASGMGNVLIDVSDSVIERFGLFTIIVLGEVVVGVVDGMSDAGRTAIAVVTGMLSLTIGFAFWWTYFDFVGSRRIDVSGRHRTMWMIGHFPVVLGIAATGPAMIGLIEHAGDARTPQPTAWLLTGAVAVTLLALIVVVRSLADTKRLPRVFGPLSWVFPAAAGAVLVLGWLHPRPWVLILGVWVILSIVWFSSIIRWVKFTDPDERVPTFDA